MKKIILIPILLLFLINIQAQEKKNDFKIKSPGKIQLSILSSYYMQNGDHAAVTGGVGSQSLQDAATNINITIPVTSNDVLKIDGTVSAYTSASSSNLNPFTGASRGGDSETGASQSGGDDDDDNEGEDDDRPAARNASNQIGTKGPWQYSDSPSGEDTWLNGVLSYTHSSENKNTIYGGKISVSHEFDYSSLGAGFHFSRLFNRKNTEIDLSATIYLDKWRPQYPTEIKMYILNNGDLRSGFFTGVKIYKQNGQIANKFGNDVWRPLHPEFITDRNRNTYTFNFGFSQILSKKWQMALLTEISYQSGQLGNPMQRVYFADKPNYYIGNPNDIPYYTEKKNTGVFHLADDYERLPASRLKIPLGMRMHYYLSDKIVLRSYYRYYYDDWGIKSHTFQIDVPYKLSDNYMIYPGFRYYTQTGSVYFAPYDRHHSYEKYYTSDYDLAPYTAGQLGLGFKFRDPFMRKHIWFAGIRNFNVNINYYYRSTGFRAFIISSGVTFN